MRISSYVALKSHFSAGHYKHMVHGFLIVSMALKTNIKARFYLNTIKIIEKKSRAGGHFVMDFSSGFSWFWSLSNVMATAVTETWKGGTNILILYLTVRSTRF